MKSKSFGSSKCVVTAFPSAVSIEARMLGISCSKSEIKRSMRLRFRFGCEPHKSHGMMGNFASAANSAMSCCAAVSERANDRVSPIV